MPACRNKVKTGTFKRGFYFKEVAISLKLQAKFGNQKLEA